MREREAAMTFLTGDADRMPTAWSRPTRPRPLPRRPRETVAELMGADDDPAIEAEVRSRSSTSSTRKSSPRRSRRWSR